MRTRVLAPPVNVLLTQVEARAIAKTPDVCSAFARWGVTFADSPAIQEDIPSESQEGETAYVQVAVATVPEVVADKVRFSASTTMTKLTGTTAAAGWGRAT